MQLSAEVVGHHWVYTRKIVAKYVDVKADRSPSHGCCSYLVISSVIQIPPTK